MEKKFIAAAGLVCFLPAVSCWAAPDLYVSGGVTYGEYMDSIERDYIVIERLNLSMIPDITSGLTLHAENVNLNKKRRFEDIDQYQVGLSGYKAFWTPAVNGYLGGRLDVQYLNSDDELTDDAVIPYVAATYKSREGRFYFDVGYAFSDYDQLEIDQYTVTAGISLLDGRIWSQTRAYWIDPDERVQGEDETFAVEERLTYYAVPDKLSLSFYGLLGKRLFAYDPDIFAVYNLADLQEGSLGGTVSYQLTPSLSVLGDVTYEAYENKDLRDEYGVVYGTASLTYQF